jgi:hypothetical protein
MNRREFLHSASAGTIGLGSLPLLGSKAWTGQDCHDEDKEKGFHFVVVSYPVGGGNDRLLFWGDGTFDEDGVEGGGKFDHWQATGALPAPIVSSGKWKAKKFVSFVLPTNTVPGDPEATHGPFQAGILTLKADFYPVGEPKIKDVVLEIVCNLGPAGASTTGKDEGVYTTFQGVAFQPPGTGNTGITLFDA